jgi:hypothetical protein
MPVATSVALRLPPGWIELDPREPDLVVELERALGVPDEARDDVLRLLAPLALELHRTAAEGNVVLVGLFAQAFPVEGSDDPYVMTAHVLLSVSPPVSGLEEVKAGLAELGGEVSPVDLPAGAGVRAAGETQISDPSWETDVPARSLRYAVPVPGTPAVAILSFLTPNLDLTEEFDEVFDAIAATLTFEGGTGS